MMKKSVVINEDKNEIRYYVKDNEVNLFDILTKYLCSSTSDSYDEKPDDNYMILKSGKKILRN